MNPVRAGDTRRGCACLFRSFFNLVMIKELLLLLLLPPTSNKRLSHTPPGFPRLREEEEDEEEEEEEEEEEGLYLRLETRERVQTNEARSKRRRASPT